jgi:hypothetical protein
LFETIISLKNKNAFYAFNMQKTGLIGSFIYEIVKKIVMQGKNKNVERLFFSNFSVDHLGTNVANNLCSSFTRTANRGFFIVEMLRILEIMDFVGPNNIIVGSCQTTTGNVDLLNCAIEETREFTQNSQNYSPTHPIYIPNSPQYSPTSPIYIPTLSKPLDEMTIGELSFEGQLTKRPQSHRNKRFDRKYNKTQKQHRHVGKIKGREIYGIDGERGYYVIENGNYVKIKIDKYKKELSFRSKKNNLREYKSNNAKTASIHKMLEMSREGQKTRKVRR